MKPVLAILLLASSIEAAAQRSRTAFDVASVKADNSGERASSTLSPPGGRFSAKNVSLKLLVRTAYQLSDYQVSGGPDWIRFDRFDVEAKSDSNPSQDEIRMMVQDLLQDRFKLKVHRVTEQDTVYALAVAKGGPKMKAVPDDGSGRHLVGATQGHLLTKNGEIAGLVTYLTQILDRQVIDKTGLHGYFEFDFALPPTILPSPDSPVSIFEAIQDQLGLRLEQTKGPVEFLIIDQAERPSPN